MKEKESDRKKDKARWKERKKEKAMRKNRKGEIQYKERK